MKLRVPLGMKSNLARQFVHVSKIQNGIRSEVRAREIYSRRSRGRYRTNGGLETVSVRSVPGVLVSRKSPEPIRAIIVKSNFSGSNFHLGSPGFPKLIPVPSERGEKIREQGGPVVVVPVFHPRPLHPRGHIASLSCSPRFTSLFLSLSLSRWFPSARRRPTRLVLLSQPLFSNSFAVSVALADLRWVRRCLKSSGRQADLRYATAPVWAPVRARALAQARGRTRSTVARSHSPAHAEQGPPTR